MKKYAKMHASILAVATAICLSAYAGPTLDKSYNLAKAEVVDQVILAVIENYYDPSRIDSQAMFKAALDTAQKAVAEMTVNYSADNKTSTLVILDKKLSIDLERLTNPWRLSKAMHRVFRFIGENAPKQEYDFKDIEYAIANGMLSVLDPHSNVLPPDIYESLMMDTAGEFGGLGIRITTDRRPPCNGNLTVAGVLENTPAWKAGIKIGDRITRIDGESTVNITSSEAANRLRGKPGSSVKIEIERANSKPKIMSIRRDTVPILSVKWRLLEGKVGYISLEQFQGNSADEVTSALAALQNDGMKGLILDLRGNPGGLLDIAIRIADKFLDSGTIVATAGRDGKNDQSITNASPLGTEPNYPLVLLIDGSSASAAEIIAGALGNHGRALLVGETTFGKGSVQMVRPLALGGALKLTSAQYLTPGDISIQAVGVSPDIAFVPFTIDDKDTDWGHRGEGFSEADLEHHLDRPAERRAAYKNGMIKGILYIPAKERAIDQARFERCYLDDDEQYSYQGKYEVEFARRLIASFKGKTTDELLSHAKQQIEKDDQEQAESIRQALKRLHVTWKDSKLLAGDSDPKTEENPKVKAQASLIGKSAPQSSFKIKVTVKNTGKDPIEGLQAKTKCDNYLLDGIDFVFGEVPGGQTRSWAATVEVPPIAPARTDSVKVLFKSSNGPIPSPIYIDVNTQEFPQPHLAYSWQFEDLGNLNGLVEPGEEVLMHLTVKNMGLGSTVAAKADLSGKPGVDVIWGSFDLGKLMPGDTVLGVFKLRVSKQFTQPEAIVDLAVSDYIPARILTARSLLNREIELRISPPSPGSNTASGSLTVTSAQSAIPLLEGPFLSSRTIATASAGAAFNVTRTRGDYYQIALPKERHAWVSKSNTIPGGSPDAKYKDTLIEPPVISVEGNRVFKVEGKSAVIKGSASHPEKVRDLMVYVGDQKIMYEPNRDPKSPNKMLFNVEVPIKEGSNYVIIVARYDDKTISTFPVFIRREQESH